MSKSVFSMPFEIYGRKAFDYALVPIAALFIYSGAVLDVKADELTGSPPPLPLTVGEHIAADVVDLIFLFDRAVSDPPRATTPNYLARVSDPSSASYQDYLDYRQGTIDRIELVDRLPHVAMIGDSLSLNFHFSSLAGSFWRARTQWRKNWFLDSDPDPKSIFSVYERLGGITPVVITEYSGAGALVAPPQSQEDLKERLVRTRNLPGQVRQVLHRKRFPDLIMIWIGHNNLDWVNGLSEQQRQHPEKHLREIAAQFRVNYTESMQSLIDRARTQNHKVAIVVFGLANIDAYLKARRQAATLHAQNPKLYPHLNSGIRHFESLKPPYQETMAKLSLMMNNQLRAMVAVLSREPNNGHVRVEYSDALTNVDFSRLEFINPVDGWHPSMQAHKALARAAFNALHPSLLFLRVETKPILKPSLQVSDYRAR